MSITVITPTGGRPQAFKLLTQYLCRQTYSESIQWIIVDDCVPRTPVPSICGLKVTSVYPEPPWHPGLMTLSRNVLGAMPFVKNDFVVFMEDDDWYAPTYLEVMQRRLSEFSLVGEMDCLYYSVPQRCYYENQNKTHSSLCQVGFRSEQIPRLIELCNVCKKYLDVEWFRRTQGYLYPHSGLCIGMKGLPGRPGAGIGANPSLGNNWKADPDGSYLRRLLGRDADLYLKGDYGSAEEVRIRRADPVQVP